jgi:hypothetical protein
MSKSLWDFTRMFGAEIGSEDDKYI